MQKNANCSGIQLVTVKLLSNCQTIALCSLIERIDTAEMSISNGTWRESTPGKCVCVCVCVVHAIGLVHAIAGVNGSLTRKIG